MRSRIAASTGLLMLVLTGAAWAQEASELGLGPLIAVEPLPPNVEEELARHVIESFLEPDSATTLTAALDADRQPRMIFASISDGSKAAYVLRATGMGAAQTIGRLTQKWRDERQSEERADEMPESVRWIRVDIVHNVILESGLDPAQPLHLPRSLFGLAFEPEIGAAFLPGELVAQTLVDSDQEMRIRKIASRLDSVSHAEALGRAVARRSLDIYRFSTSAYFSDGTEDLVDGEPRPVVPLYRGHRRYEETTPEQLLETAKRGGEYLIRAVRSDGRFVYSYRPKTDDERDRYNMLRHAGTIYSMLELYEVTGERRLLAAAERAIGFLLRNIRPCAVGEGERREEVACVVEKGYVKLGGNALAIIALVQHAEVTGSRDHLPLIDRLGRWILGTQSEAGEFTVHKIELESGKLDDHISQYYPGEAVLALLRGSQLSNALARRTAAKDTWLDAAARGARWLIEVRDHDVPLRRLNHDHWLLYGLNELYRRRPEPLYLKHAERTTAAILRLQNRRPSYPDWRGSYYHPPRSTPTATRSEGLAAAYLLQRDHGSAREAARLLEGLELGVRFQLQTQVRPETALYLPNPRRALGGFRRSLTNYEIRIDYVQHNISALLLHRRILIEQAEASAGAGPG